MPYLYELYKQVDKALDYTDCAIVQIRKYFLSVYAS